MDLKQIRYLVAIADAGSFVGGARRAYVKQPTLSAAITALETEIGGRIFERSTRGVTLTLLGEQALVQARTILRESEKLRTIARKSRLRLLRIGLLPTLAPAFVATTVNRLKSLTDESTLRVEDAPLDVLRRRLAAGRYDAILTSLGPLAKDHRQLELARDAQALAFAIEQSPPGAVGPELLAGRALIVRTHCEQLQAASRILDEHGVKPNVVARTDSDSRALALVAAGIGTCLMPDSFEAAGVVFIRPRGVGLTRRLGFEWISDPERGRFDLLAERF